MNVTPAPWSVTTLEILEQLKSNEKIGLSSAEVAQRIAEYGPNSLPEPAPDPLWKRYWGQLTGDAVVRLLLFGGILSLLLKDWLEGIAILVMLNIMAGFGLWQEGKATDAAKALRSNEKQYKTVIRDGKRQQILVEDICVGDIIYLATGDVCPADGRVLFEVNAEKDTSKLTGESLTVHLRTDPLPALTVVNEQTNMVHRGDSLLAGNATMIVTSTGSKTEIGKIAQALNEGEAIPTPLDEQLDSLGDAMARIFLWLAVFVIGAGVLFEFYTMFQNHEVITLPHVIDILKEAFINAVALIIAAIPEGLPAVLTITIAIATGVMVKRNALVRKPKAVEGSGSMNVLLTDKTGTLTANKMTVTHLYLNGSIVEVEDISDDLAEDSLFARAIRIGKLCNNNSGATESAVLAWIEESELTAIGDSDLRVAEHPFDQTLKRMTTVYAVEEYYHVFTKGAPEIVLDLCHKVHLGGRDRLLTADDREKIQAAIKELAMHGLRVIALADRVVEELPDERHEAEIEMTFVGLLGIMDPARPDVRAAVAELEKAGIRTVMVTGDNALTAYAVAKDVGIIHSDIPFDQAIITGDELQQLDNPSAEFLSRLRTVRVFARVTPQHKAQIVKLMREAGFIVGMTGDGVNDAIALKQSDVGLSMGNGTDVAREASDIILLDSLFSTIPVAVEEGRNVLHRIRLYLSYILSGNGCEVGAFIAAYALNLPIPFTALVLLIINFATDSFPALAMAYEKGEPDVMSRQPRKREEPFINRLMWTHIGVQTVIATIVIMAVYYYFLNVLHTELPVARSAAFLTYISQKLFRAFTARSLTRPIWEIGFFENRHSVYAVLLSLGIALFFVYMPFVNKAVGLTGVAFWVLGLTTIVGVVPALLEELTKVVLKNQEKQGGAV